MDSYEKTINELKLEFTKEKRARKLELENTEKLLNEKL